jgi:hypothetical protein
VRLDYVFEFDFTLASKVKRFEVLDVVVFLVSAFFLSVLFVFGLVHVLLQECR